MTEIDTIKVHETPSPLARSRWQRVRRWVLIAAAVLAVLAVLNFVVAALGAKLGLWGWQFGLGVMSAQVGPLLLGASIVAGITALLFALLVKPRRGIAVAALALIVGVVGIARLSAVRATVASLPFIHDVSTDTEDPPVFTDVILTERAAVPGVNTLDYVGKTAPKAQADGTTKQVLVSALQTQGYPEIRTLVLSEPVDVVFGRAEQVARDLGWKIKSSDVEAGTIEATATTFWYGFEDDVAIRLRPAAGGGTRVDARSVSRVGGSDIGANAERLQDFLNAMRE